MIMLLGKESESLKSSSAELLLEDRNESPKVRRRFEIWKNLQDDRMGAVMGPKLYGIGQSR